MSRPKLTITHVVTAREEVEIPESCPHCGAPIEGKTVVGQYSFSNQFLTVDPTKEDLEWGGTEHSWEDDLVLFLECHACGGNVIQALEQEISLEVLEKLETLLDKVDELEKLQEKIDGP